LKLLLILLFCLYNLLAKGQVVKSTNEIFLSLGAGISAPINNYSVYGPTDQLVNPLINEYFGSIRASLVRKNFGLSIGIRIGSNLINLKADQKFNEELSKTELFQNDYVILEQEISNQKVARNKFWIGLVYKININKINLFITPCIGTSEYELIYPVSYHYKKEIGNEIYKTNFKINSRYTNPEVLHFGLTTEMAYQVLDEVAVFIETGVYIDRMDITIVETTKNLFTSTEVISGTYKYKANLKYMPFAIGIRGKLSKNNKNKKIMQF
jgi:hypothetical protein